MDKAISTHLFLFEPFDDLLADLIAEHGFFAVEIWGMKPHIDYDDPDSIELLSKRLGRRGIRVLSVHAPAYRSLEDAMAGRWISLTNADPEVRDLGVSESEKAIRFAGALGAERMVLHPGNPEDPWSPEIRERFEACLDRLLPTAAREGIQIAVENINTDFSTTDHLMTMLERYDRDRVGVCLDMGHASLNEEPVRAIECCGSRLVTLHAHDNDGKWDAHFVPGQGEIEWGAVVKALRGEAYVGPLVFEIGDPDKDRSNGLERFRPVLAEVNASYHRLAQDG